MGKSFAAEGSRDHPKRLAYIDLAKAFAAWMVVTAHLIRNGILADFLAAVSVSAFFLLAGMTARRHEDPAAFLRHLIRRIVVPYIVVGLISIVIFQGLGQYAASVLQVGEIQMALPANLWNLVYGSSVDGRMKWNESLWFLPCYLVLILLTEGILWISRKRPLLSAAWYAAAGIFGYLLVLRGMTGLPWHLETALLMLPVSGVGRVLRYFLDTRKVKPAAAFLCGAVLLAGGILLYYRAYLYVAGQSFSLRGARLFGPVTTYSVLLAGSIGVVLLAQAAVTSEVGRILADIGSHSLAIVLWNKFPVLVVQGVIPAVVPVFDTGFISGTGAGDLLTAAFLAIPCILLCLLWHAVYSHVLWQGVFRNS